MVDGGISSELRIVITGASCNAWFARDWAACESTEAEEDNAS